MSTHADLDTLSVSAAYLASVIGAAEQRGLSRALLLDALSLNESALEERERRIPARLFLNLLENIALHGIDDIGLVMAAQARPGTFSALGYAAMSCSTLGDAAALISSYEAVVLDLGTTTLHLHGDLATIAWHAKHPAAQRRAMHDMIVAGWFCFALWVTGVPRITPRRVLFSHPKPTDADAYIRLFGCEIQFDAKTNAIEFDASFLATPIMQADHAFNRMMRQKADDLLAQLATAGTLRQRVVALLQTALPRQQASLVQTADTLGLSERTLRRRLADEHCSFQQLLTEVRTRLATVYLKDPTLTLLDIALLLGYADQSSFTTAFKAWHGVTPSHWRDEVGRN